jgi:nucleotide-binding universal stress UspA family protein
VIIGVDGSRVSEAALAFAFWVSGLVLGSVSHAVLHRSACPVAIVRADLGSGPR